MIIVIRYIIYEDKYTKFNYFLDFKIIIFFISFIHTQIIFYIYIFFWKKKIPNLNLHNIHLPCNLIFFFFILIVFYLIILSKYFLLSRASHGHNTSANVKRSVMSLALKNEH